MSTRVSYAEAFSSNTAENYERYFVPVIPAKLAPDLLDAAKLVPGEHVLDVACGTGVVTRLAAERVAPTGKVVGLDPTPPMLDVARSIPVPSSAAVEWRQGTAEQLPVDDEAFDAVLCQLGLMFVPDKPGALAEFRRVLGPGGRVAINVAGHAHPTFDVMADALAHHVDPDLAGFVKVVFSLADPALIESLLTQAGFTDVAVEVVPKTITFPPPADFLWQYIHATPLAGLVAQASPEVQAALTHDVVERWQPWATADGMVGEQDIVVATARA